MKKAFTLVVSAEKFDSYHRGDVLNIEIVRGFESERHNVKIISKYKLKSSGERQVKFETVSLSPVVK